MDASFAGVALRQQEFFQQVIHKTLRTSCGSFRPLKGPSWFTAGRATKGAGRRPIVAEGSINPACWSHPLASTNRQTRRPLPQLRNAEFRITESPMAMVGW